VPEVAAAEALGHAQLVAVRMTHRVEHGLVVESRCLDDERVALPSSNRVAEVRRQAVVDRKLPASPYLCCVPISMPARPP